MRSLIALRVERQKMDQSQINVVAQQFVQSYYQTFDTNRGSLAAIYRPESLLQFEGSTFQGPEAIVQKLTSLSFQVVQHAISTTDAQMTVDGGLIIFVVGQLKADQDPVIPFSQAFYVKQFGDSLFVLNDIFRLALHHQ